MPDASSDFPRCTSCGQAQRTGSRFCPNCGYSPDGVASAAVADDAAESALRFGAQWDEIKRVGLLFTLVLLASFIGGLSARSYRGPQLEVLMTAVIALLTIPFARTKEIVGLLKPPAANRDTTLQMLGAACAVVVMLSGYFALLHYWLGIPRFDAITPFARAAWPVWSIYLTVSILPAVVEELTFRGVIQTTLEHVFSKRDAWLIQAALFSILHLSPAIFPSHFAMGLCFGFLRNKSKSLYPGMLLHAAWNAWVVFQDLHTR